MFSVVTEEESLWMQESWGFAANPPGHVYLQNRTWRCFVSASFENHKIPQNQKKR